MTKTNQISLFQDLLTSQLLEGFHVPLDCVEQFVQSVLNSNEPIELMAGQVEEDFLNQTNDIQAKIYDPKGILMSGELNPQLSQKVELLLQKAQDEGLPVFLFEGYRSPERQNRLFNSGKNVTKARGGDSYHNYGLAVDIVFYDEKGNPSWSNDHDWKRLGEMGKELGLTWGGDFRSLIDMAHFEYHPDLKLDDVKELHKEGGLQEVWDAIKD